MSNQKIAVGLAGILVGMAIFFLMFYTMSPIPQMLHTWDRVIYTIQCGAFPFLVLILATYCAMCSTRCTEAVEEKCRTLKHGATRDALGIAFTQLFLFFGLLCMLSTYLGPAGMRLVPAMTTVFSVALLLFWMGRQHKTEQTCTAWKNTFGLAIVLFTNLCLVVTNIVYFFMAH